MVVQATAVRKPDELACTHWPFPEILPVKLRPSVQRKLPPPEYTPTQPIGSESEAAARLRSPPRNEARSAPMEAHELLASAQPNPGESCMRAKMECVSGPVTFCNSTDAALALAHKKQTTHAARHRASIARGQA